MRFILCFLSGAVGMIAGWYLTGMVVINTMAARDLGDVFVAFIIVAPIGGLVGLIVGVLLFNKLVVVGKPVAPSAADRVTTPD